MTTTVDIVGGDPTSDYALWLYYDAPNPCNYGRHLGKIKIDSSGHGHKVATAIGTSGQNDWIVFAENGNGFYDTSQIAHLGA